MSEGMLLAIVVGVGILAMVLIFLIDRRVNTQGNLFVGPATLKSRVLAFALGLLFTALMVWELLEGAYLHWLSEWLLWAILVVALFAYSLGADGLLKRIQQNNPTETNRFAVSPVHKRLRLVLLLALIGVCIFAGIVSCGWIQTHPKESSPLVFAVIVAVIGLFVFGYVFSIIEIVKLLWRNSK